MIKLNLKTKVLLICAALNLMQIVNGGLGIFEMSRFNSKFSELISQDIPAMNALTSMKYWLTRSRMMMSRWAIPLTNAQFIDTELKVKEALTEFKRASAKFVKNVKNIEKQQEFKKILSFWEVFESESIALDAKAKAGDPKLSHLVEEAIHSDKSKMREVAISLDKALTGLIEATEQENEKIQKDATKSYEEGRMTQWTLIILGFLLAQIMAQIFSNRLSRKLDKIGSTLEMGAGQISEAAASVSSTSNTISQVVNQQVSALHQTATAIKQLNVMVDKNADNASRSHQVTNQSSQQADRGKTEVEQTIRAIEGIQEANEAIIQFMQESNNEVSKIIQVVAEIGEKTKVIHDIVFQTKLLSFNASVEAARAGEHGKGFAVVAEEVGNLAQMSGNAAKEIFSMLEASIQKLDSVVQRNRVQVEQLVSNGREKVNSGKNLAQRSNQVLEEIVTGTGEVRHRVTEITQVSDEQSKGIREINSSMVQLDLVTRENSKTALKAAEVSQLLSNHTETMREMVNALLREVHG